MVIFKAFDNKQHAQREEYNPLSQMLEMFRRMEPIQKMCSPILPKIL